jgi:hypothetical protein
MRDLYESNVLVWSEHQAELLRRLAGGERVNDLVDWENVIEEVESVGSEQLHIVESLLVQAIAHRLKAQGWPPARDLDKWQADAERLRGDAVSRFTPSMRQRIDVARLYRRGCAPPPPGWTVSRHWRCWRNAPGRWTNY